MTQLTAPRVAAAVRAAAALTFLKARAPASAYDAVPLQRPRGTGPQHAIHATMRTNPLPARIRLRERSVPATRRDFALRSGMPR